MDHRIENLQYNGLHSAFFIVSAEQDVHTPYGQATVPAVPASIVVAWLSLTCVNADSGRRWRTSLTTARRQSSPAGWRLFMRLSTMLSIGFRIRRRKHSRNEPKCIQCHIPGMKGVYTASHYLPAVSHRRIRWQLRQLPSCSDIFAVGRLIRRLIVVSFSFSFVFHSVDWFDFSLFFSLLSRPKHFIVARNDVF